MIFPKIVRLHRFRKDIVINIDDHPPIFVNAKLGKALIKELQKGFQDIRDNMPHNATYRHTRLDSKGQKIRGKHHDAPRNR